MAAVTGKGTGVAVFFVVAAVERVGQVVASAAGPAADLATGFHDFGAVAAASDALAVSGARWVLSDIVLLFPSSFIFSL